MRYSGTGFGIKSPGLVLTASHCLGNAKGPDEVYLGARDGGFLPASCMKRHPEADIAALVFEADRAPSCFELGEPPENDGEFYMGTEISSYGYPSREGGPDKTILEPRLMRGHIQRNFQYEWGDLRRRYHAFELSFPVLPGQSGSPVFLDHEIRSTIAVLTTSFESSVVIDMYEEENQKMARMRFTKHQNRHLRDLGGALEICGLAMCGNKHGQCLTA